MIMQKCLILLVCAGLFCSAGGKAETLTAIDAGFVTEAGGSAKGDGTITPDAKYNYSVGRELHYADGAIGSPLAPMDRKNYFIFDLTGVTEMIISAKLTLWTGTYESVDPMEGFGFFNTTDPGAALALAMALAGATMTSEFDDPSDPLVMSAAMLYAKLADGPMFLGGIVISSAADDSFIDITFTPAGLTYLNSFLGGTLILGGSVPGTLPHSPPDSPQQPFGFTGPDSFPGSKTPTLTITTVPEPSVAILLCLAGAMALALRHRHTRA